MHSGRLVASLIRIRARKAPRFPIQIVISCVWNYKLKSLELRVTIDEEGNFMIAINSFTFFKEFRLRGIRRMMQLRHISTREYLI